MFCSRDTGKLYNSRGVRVGDDPTPANSGLEWGHSANLRRDGCTDAGQESVDMRDERPEKREESPWVMVARYSEIGFMIPAAVIVGYLLGWLADYLLHTHWLYLVGIIFRSGGGVCVDDSAGAAGERRRRSRMKRTAE